MRWLAVDVGTRRVGLAVCDCDERIITPLRAVAFKGPIELAEQIRRLWLEYELEGVVVGVPTTRHGGSRGELRVAEVAASVRAAELGPLELVDERGTTAEAESRLAAAGAPRGRWRDLVDSVAAQVILETFLASRHRARSERPVDPVGHEC